MHHVADGRIPILAVGAPHAALGRPFLTGAAIDCTCMWACVAASLKIGTLAVAPLGDIEHGFEHPSGEAVGTRDFGRDDGVAVSVEIGDIGLQAKLADVVPCAIEAGLQVGRWFCHDAFSPVPSNHSNACAPHLAIPDSLITI